MPESILLVRRLLAAAFIAYFGSKEPFLGLIGLVLVGPPFHSIVEKNLQSCPAAAAEDWKWGEAEESRRRLSLNFEIELSVALSKLTPPFLSSSQTLFFPIH